MLICFFANFLIVRHGPYGVTKEYVAFDLLPSGSLASMKGFCWSNFLPTLVAILFSSASNSFFSVYFMFVLQCPYFLWKTNTSFSYPFTIISSRFSSSSISWSFP